MKVLLCITIFSLIALCIAAPPSGQHSNSENDQEDPKFDEIEDPTLSEDEEQPEPAGDDLEESKDAEAKEADEVPEPEPAEDVEPQDERHNL